MTWLATTGDIAGDSAQLQYLGDLGWGLAESYRMPAEKAHRAVGLPRAEDGVCAVEPCARPGQSYVGRVRVCVADAHVERHHRPHDRMDVPENRTDDRGRRGRGGRLQGERAGLAHYLTPSLSKAACSDWTYAWLVNVAPETPLMLAPWAWRVWLSSRGSAYELT